VASRDIRPYGSWPSPIDATAVVAGATGLSQLALDGADAYWVEARPTEAGRNVVVRRAPDGSMADVIPVHHNARSRVHEYGGGAFVASDRVVWYSNDVDRRVYRCADGADGVPITPEGPVRYADFALDPRRRRLLCVAETHHEGREPTNALVALRADAPSAPAIIACGADFYSSPRISPGGDRLAWLEWHHPDMPWDGTTLKCARIDDGGGVVDVRTIAGGRSESVFQPAWSPDGTLYFVSDRSGYWNLYRHADGEPRPVCPMSAEFGRPH
jgi:WD40-like Beta Propeller Repeat